MAANVAVIGETVRKNLFGATDPIGETVRINNLPFKVVGLLTAKGTSAAMGQDQDDIILVPITTLQKKITGQDWLRWIMVSAVSKDASYTAQQQITALLRDRHRIRSAQDDDFFVRNLADMADLADQNAQVVHYPAGFDRKHFPAGRRHRHHEHHAGFGHRAHARDRYSHGHWRHRGRCAAAVPD